MLKKRIIPCLDIRDGRTVKGVNFLGIEDVGNPVKLAKIYAKQGADELVFLDITATVEKRKTLVELVSKISKEIDIPFTVGGGINSIEDAKAVIDAGADKISLNSSVVKSPKLIQDISNLFGSQCVVVAMDTKNNGGAWEIYIHGGRIPTGVQTVEWAKKVEQLGAGEILLTSMQSDGTKQGFTLEITQQVSQAVNIPVIASGGAGSITHFKTLFTKTSVTAGLAASIFHYGEISIKDLKQTLKQAKIQIR